MRRRNTQSLGEVLQEVLVRNHLDKRLNETRLLEAWNEVLGEAMARYTTEKFIRNRVLNVKLTSAVLRNELMLGRELLIRKLNEKVGAEVITDIRFY